MVLQRLAFKGTKTRTRGTSARIDGVSVGPIAGCGSSLLAVLLNKQVEHLAGLRMATRLSLGVDQIPVDCDIEDSFGAGDERQGMHDVLISREDVARHAHGAVQIVSGNAVGDFDLKHEAKITASTDA